MTNNEEKKEETNPRLIAVAEKLNKILTKENVGIQPTIRYLSTGIIPSFTLVDLDEEKDDDTD